MRMLPSAFPYTQLALIVVSWHTIESGSARQNASDFADMIRQTLTRGHEGCFLVFPDSCLSFHERLSVSRPTQNLFATLLHVLF